jgi:uncharacterized protein YbjT (DUF2867 family)
MRILLTGATGFIGRALRAELLRRGHQVVPVLRRAPAAGGGEFVQADLADVPLRGWWQPRLAGIDAVVNSVGILRESGRQRFQALHTDAPVELFHACAAAGVNRVVQLSALGADAGAQSRYHLSKKAADDALRSLPLRSAIVQPSVVYGPDGSSAAMFNKMAVAPLLPLPAGGTMAMQPVHVDDVVEGIVRWLESPTDGTQTLGFAGPRACSMREYLASLRSQLGVASPLRVIPVPAPLFLAGAHLAGWIPGSVLDSETAAMLLRGSQTGDNALPRLLGREPRPVERFVAPQQVAAR